MRIFLTGATGYVGAAALGAFVRAGHEVTAMVRNPERARLLAGPGVRPVVGDLAASEDLRGLAAGHDVYVLAAFESSSRGIELDRLAIENLIAVARTWKGETRVPGPRRLIYTSGVWVLGPTREPATEASLPAPAAHVAWRPAHEQRVLAGADDALRTMVVRPGILYGGARGIVGDLFRDAANGLVRVFGPGENRWPLIYDRDLGDLYARLAVHPDASGIYHATDEGDERVNDLVDAIRAQVPIRPAVRHIPLQEAQAKHGTYAMALALDQVVRCPRAHALGWSPSLTSVAGNAARLFEEWRNGQRTADATS